MTDVIRSTPSDNYFAAEPRSVKPKGKYRNTQNKDEKSESRVVRGNTYSSYMVAQREIEALESAKKKKKHRTRRIQEENYHHNEREENSDFEYNGVYIPPPPGCGYAQAYTDEDTETMTDLPPCHDAITQTEFVIEKELPDLSMPVYTGIHKETQIYASENLFDFDYEAEPVVQVLVTRCLEESRIEVVEEEELRVLKERQVHLQKIFEKEEKERRELEHREREKDRVNKKKNDERRRRKNELIDTHQHMISRVYTKRFLDDTKRAAFEILENMCMFMDEDEKDIKDNFMPWLYEQTLDIAKNRHEKTKEVDYVIDNLQKEFLATHRHSVFEEMERRRLAKEEEERLLKEREERRRKKLEYKLKRREDRRLYYKENDIFESFINKGDFDNEIVNISEFDGSDAGGNKSIGFRGGLIGEFYLFLQKLKNSELFKDLEFTDQVIRDTWESIFNNFVTQGWTVYIGLKFEFERNYKHFIEEFEFPNFDLDYVRSIEDPDDYDTTVDYIIKHYVSVYFNDNFPKLAKIQEKELAKLRPPEPKETEPEGEEEEKDEGEEEEGEEEEGKEKEKKKNIVEAAPEEEPAGEEEQEEDDGDNEYREFKTFAEKIIRKIFDRASGVRNVKFNLCEEFEKEVKETEPAEEDESQGGEEQPETNVKPLALCLFIPEPEPEEEVDEEKKEGDEEHEAPEVENTIEAEPDGEGEEEQAEKEPEEVYLKPYVPKEEFFTQPKFSEDLTQIEHILNNVRVQSIHFPLLNKFRHSLLDILSRIMKIELDDEEISTFMNKCNLETVEEIRQYCKNRDGLDLMYINAV